MGTSFYSLPDTFPFFFYFTSYYPLKCPTDSSDSDLDSTSYYPQLQPVFFYPVLPATGTPRMLQNLHRPGAMRKLAAHCALKIQTTSQPRSARHARRSISRYAWLPSCANNRSSSIRAAMRGCKFHRAFCPTRRPYEYCATETDQSTFGGARRLQRAIWDRSRARWQISHASLPAPGRCARACRRNISDRRSSLRPTGRALLDRAPDIRRSEERRVG